MDSWWHRLRWTGRVALASAALVALMLAIYWQVLPTINDVRGTLGLPNLTLGAIWAWVWGSGLHALAVAVTIWAAALFLPDLVGLIVSHRSRSRLSGDQRELIEGVRGTAGRIVGLFDAGAYPTFVRDRMVEEVNALFIALTPFRRQWPEECDVLQAFYDRAREFQHWRTMAHRSPLPPEMSELIQEDYSAVIRATSDLLEPDSLWGSWAIRARRL